MELNLSSEARKYIYIVTGIASPIMYYLNQQNVVNDFWIGLFAVVVTAVNSLAAYNVSNK